MELQDRHLRGVRVLVVAVRLLREQPARHAIVVEQVVDLGLGPVVHQNAGAAQPRGTAEPDAGVAGRRAVRLRTGGRAQRDDPFRAGFAEQRVAEQGFFAVQRRNRQAADHGKLLRGAVVRHAVNRAGPDIAVTGRSAGDVPGRQAALVVGVPDQRAVAAAAPVVVEALPGAGGREPQARADIDRFAPEGHVGGDVHRDRRAGAVLQHRVPAAGVDAARNRGRRADAAGTRHGHRGGRVAGRHGERQVGQRLVEAQANQFQGQGVGLRGARAGCRHHQALGARRYVDEYPVVPPVGVQRQGVRHAVHQRERQWRGDAVARDLDGDHADVVRGVRVGADAHGAQQGFAGRGAEILPADTHGEVFTLADDAGAAGRESAAGLDRRVHQRRIVAAVVVSVPVLHQDPVTARRQVVQVAALEVLGRGAAAKLFPLGRHPVPVLVAADEQVEVGRAGPEGLGKQPQRAVRQVVPLGEHALAAVVRIVVGRILHQRFGAGLGPGRAAGGERGFRKRHQAVEPEQGRAAVPIGGYPPLVRQVAAIRKHGNGQEQVGRTGGFEPDLPGHPVADDAAALDVHRDVQVPASAVGKKEAGRADRYPGPVREADRGGRPVAAAHQVRDRAGEGALALAPGGYQPGQVQFGRLAAEGGVGGQEVAGGNVQVQTRVGGFIELRAACPHLLGGRSLPEGRVRIPGQFLRGGQFDR